MEENKDPFKSFIQNLTPNERIVVAVLSGWFVIKFCLFAFTEPHPSFWKPMFWPFETDSIREYGLLEFFIYGLAPLFSFGLYRYLNKQAQ